MKILILHNRYKYEGGENKVVLAERDLLKSNGHKVLVFELSNKDIFKCSIFRKILLPFRIAWSLASYRKVKKIMQKEKPDIVHVHNTFFLLSPSVYYACRDANVPIVQTLHNYRFLCPMATLYREGKICRECLDKGLLMSIKNKCVKKSLLWALATLWTLKLHYKNNTFKRFINTYIALSDFSKRQFIEGGFNPERIRVKPNFINFDPGCDSNRENFALYAGRLSQEKGIDLLLDTWKNINYLPLKIIGTGSKLEEFKNYARENSLDVEFLGHRPNSEVINYLKKCLVVVLPSRCNENFPRVIVEAFACGVAIIASRRGAISEIIEDGKTGLLFDPDDPDDLLNKIKLVYRNREMLKIMSKNARFEYDERYTAEKNYQILMSIYRDTIDNYNA